MEKTVRTTFPSFVPAARSAHAQDYSQRGWTVAETANGVCLITDENTAGIEVCGELATVVRRYLRANNLTGPIVALPGRERREIHLVTGVRKAARALAALRDAGLMVYGDGAGIPLPPTRVCTGCATWAVSPDDARWLPPVVAVAAAVRAAGSVLATGPAATTRTYSAAVG